MIAEAAKAWVKASWAAIQYSTRDRSWRSPHGSIVLFHRVNNDPDGNTLAVSTGMFEGYLKLFKRYFDVVSLGTLVDELKAGRSLEGKLALSFDDGYLDNYEYAVPLLSKHSLPCTFFVTTNFIESETVPWWDRDLLVKPRWMTWQHVRHVSQSGFDIGSHTLNHVDLGKITGAEAEREIFESKAILEEQLGIRVDLFSYPYGRRNQITEANRQLVRRAGYSACFSAYGGVVPDHTDPYHIRRHPVSDYHRGPWMYLYELRAAQSGAAG